LTLELASNEGNNALALARISRIGSQGREYDAVLATSAGAPESSANRFVILGSIPEPAGKR
jgi:hypothetical protein